MTPKIVFIVPYRDRKEQKHFFMKYMNYILEDYKESEYKIFFIHQNDKREFNRGGLKNIGFLVMKNQYKHSYQNITFVFNDIDSVPYKKGLLNYKTKRGTIKHFFGTRKTLGGIVSITGADFEKIGGFPNYWTWGFEDNVLYNRAMLHKLKIDRSTFFPLFNHNIIHLTDNLKRTININHTNFNNSCDEKNNLNSVFSIKYKTNKKDKHVIDINHFDILLENPRKIITREVNITDNARQIDNMIHTFRMQHPYQK